MHGLLTIMLKFLLKHYITLSQCLNALIAVFKLRENVLSWRSYAPFSLCHLKYASFCLFYLAEFLTSSLVSNRKIAQRLG